ncbi:MAG: ribosome recycling factor [Holosporaceae bacterium]|jgi:ribosome recycling factor|nr:ribosome recycling factor [Holosporaceae bacterium]
MLLENVRKRMNSSFDNLLRDFGGLRTGRVSVQILDHIMVEAYGSKVPIHQVGTISTPEAKMLTVQVWDSSLIKPTEIAIRNSQLGLNPMVDGQLIRITVPDLSEERRKEICKLAGKYAEQTRISIRNVRRDGMDEVKKQEKNKEVTEDQQKKLSDDIQKITDEFIKKIDTALSVKEKEVMRV